MTESIVYCEGYHDRAFWGSLLQRSGCTSLKGRALNDPFGKPVRGGMWAFSSATANFVRVVPCQGKDNIRPLAKTRLKERSTQAVRQIILSVDADLHADGTRATSITIGEESIVNLVAEADPEYSRDENGDFILDSGQTILSLAKWCASDAAHQEMPNQHTLERLVVAAVRAAYP